MNKELREAAMLVQHHLTEAALAFDRLVAKTNEIGEAIEVLDPELLGIVADASVRAMHCHKQNDAFLTCTVDAGTTIYGEGWVRATRAAFEKAKARMLAEVNERGLECNCPKCEAIKAAAVQQATAIVAGAAGGGA